MSRDELRKYVIYGEECTKTTMFIPLRLDTVLKEKAQEMKIGRNRLILDLIEKYVRGEISL